MFVKDVHLVWNEVSSVLKNKGILIAGFTNPLLWIFDDNEEQKGILDVKHSIPSSTLDYLPEDDFGGTRILDKHIKTFIATKAIKLKMD
ncbi:hypothetical protein IK7_03223 [Bacillus cereus VD156]|nr:hypothetical protein IK7_03223 [Bacillus cereus VD156]